MDTKKCWNAYKGLLTLERQQLVQFFQALQPKSTAQLSQCTQEDILGLVMFALYGKEWQRVRDMKTVEGRKLLAKRAIQTFCEQVTPEYIVLEHHEMDSMSWYTVVIDAYHVSFTLSRSNRLLYNGEINTQGG